MTADLPYHILLPSAHAVLPAGFSRDPFSDSILGTHGAELAVPATCPFVATDPAFLEVLGPKPLVRVLASGAPGFAHEAGVYVPSTSGGKVWFTSNLITTERADDAAAAPLASTRVEARVDVQTVDLTTGIVQTVHTAIQTGNGACPYGSKLLFCDQGSDSTPSALTILDPVTHTATPILNNFHGRRFNSLNDVVVLPSPPAAAQDLNGHARAPGPTVWFTDPTYGYEQRFRPVPQLPPQVYMFDPNSGAVRVVADGFDHPNGICFSPDNGTCYVTDTGHIHGSGRLDATRPSTVYAFDVVWRAGAPALHNRRVFAMADCGVPDGIKCDTFGNVYSGCGDGIHVWSSAGQLIGKIILGRADNNPGAGCANFCFVPGGKIVAFAENRIYLVEGLAVEGALL